MQYIKYIAALSLFAVQSQAQTTRILGENHALTTLPTTQRFLLLPIEEAQEYARVRVIQDNKEVKNFNARLAVNKVDYFVPLALDEFEEGQITLALDFHADRRVGTTLRDYACFSRMRLSDTFDKTNREKFRPAYHHTPAYGWMNDPNGMFYKDGVYHLYFQYNPYGSQWENMTWGHATSTDLVHWNQEPNAIEPDAVGTIFSGSSVVDKENTAGFGKNAIVAYYTSAGARQTQSLAYSTDNGKTFTKYANNPVLTADIPDFRDPRMFWNEDIRRWNLILAAGQEMRIYSSPNLKDWTYESSFGLGYGNHEGVWECPDLLKMKVRGTNEEKWVLICNINPGGPFGGSATQYFVGTFDGKKFTCDSPAETTKWMDYGKDHYATVTFANAPEGRHIALAWMSNWQYANNVPTTQYRSANSVPRDLDLFRHEGEVYVGVTPSRELLSLRGKAAVKTSAKQVKQLFKQPRGAYELVLDLAGKAATTLTLSNEKGERVELVYDAAARTFSMDRHQSGNVGFSADFPVKTTAPVQGDIRQLRIFVDNSSIEVFDAEGRLSMTNLVFPSSPYNALTIQHDKKIKTNLTVYPLGQ